MTKRNQASKDYINKSPESEEFIYHVKKCGTSSHIPLGIKWLDRFVRVKIEELEEE